jgi:hypothetical protein
MNYEKYENKLPFSTIRANKEAYEAYHNEDYRLKELFKADLFEELEITDNPKRELLFQKAWDRGHSAGFSEVYAEALELVDLIY